METEIAEKYQIAGLDERERGFNRLAELKRIEGRYRAFWQYERAVVTTAAYERASDALDELIRLLQARGYTQLRTRVCFRGESYLGTQEMWVEHDDPAPPEPGFLRKLLGRVRQGLGPAGSIKGCNSKD
jgi:hypothetical protein